MSSGMALFVRVGVLNGGVVPDGVAGMDWRLDLLAFFVVGVLAGAHCLGMCGPLVTAYADRFGSRDDARPGTTLTAYEVRQHALFNLGRAASYALVGALFGLVGAVAFGAADAVATVGSVVRGVAGIAVGLLVVASGLAYLRGTAGAPHGVPIVGPVFGRVTALLSGRIDSLAGSPGIVGLGALHGLLPCPIVYPAYLYAFALGDPLRGAASLAALGLGTIPTLFAYGTLLETVSATRRARLHRALGVGFVVLGYVPLQHGLLQFGVHLPALPIPFYQPL